MRKELMQSNPVLKLCFNFSLMVIAYAEVLEEKKKFVIARQLLRSGTSVGANTMEAQNSESKAAFVHKLKIAAKEAEETQYWLLLCDQSANYPSWQELLNKLQQVQLVLNKIITTSKPKM